MKPSSLLIALAFIAAAGSSAQAQKPAKGSRKANPVADSLKTLKGAIKNDVADRKAARSTGDTSRARADGARIKSEKAQAKELKAMLPEKNKKP
jgi:hypothetical protein